MNLGLIHRENKVARRGSLCSPVGRLDSTESDVPTWMRTQGWRRFGWYIWDQGVGLPGARERQVRAAEVAPEYVDVAVIRFTRAHPEIPAILEATRADL